MVSFIDGEVKHPGCKGRTSLALYLGLCRDQQKGRAVQFIRPLRVFLHLRLARTPFLEASQTESRVDQPVDVSGDRAMLLGDARSNPVSHSLPFDQIGVEGPDLGSRSENLPPLLEWCRKDGMLYRENESTVWGKASVQRTQQL